MGPSQPTPAPTLAARRGQRAAGQEGKAPAPPQDPAPARAGASEPRSEEGVDATDQTDVALVPVPDPSHVEGQGATGRKRRRTGSTSPFPTPTAA